MNKFAIEKTTLRHGWPLLALLPFSIQAAIIDNKTVDGKEDTMVVSATLGAQAGKETGYQPHKTVTGTRTESRLLDVPQAVNVVPTQVLEDRAVRNIDEALYNVSGITQSNTLGGTQDAIIKRGFGDNRDGSIFRDGVRSIQARNFTPSSDRVEVLKALPPCSTAWVNPVASLISSVKNPNWYRKRTLKAGEAASRAAADSWMSPVR